MDSDDLMDLYKQNLVHPTWDIGDQGKGTEGAWLTWTVLDTKGGLAYGSLTIVAAGVDSQDVSLSLRSSFQDGPKPE